MNQLIKRKNLIAGLLGLGLFSSSHALWASQALEYGIEWNTSQNMYEVFMKPNATPIPNNSLSGQITIRVPSQVSFTPPPNPSSAVNNVTWTLASSIEAPAENPAFSYYTYSMETTHPNAFNWQADTALKVFEMGGGCITGVQIMDNNDPLNTDNGNINVTNQFTNIGWLDNVSLLSENNYLGNYGAVVDCSQVPTLSASTAGLSVAENSVFTHDFSAAVTNLAEASPVVFSITGGADAAHFKINQYSGELSFDETLVTGGMVDFEAPLDADTDNVYEVTVAASNVKGTAEQTIALTITDVNEQPTLSVSDIIPIEVCKATNTATSFPVAELTAADIDAGTIINYTLSGADMASFSITPDTVSAAPFTSELALTTLPATMGTYHYEIDITASDNGVASDPNVLSDMKSANIELRLGDNTAPSFTSAASFDVLEGSTAVSTLAATDAESNPITYSISGGEDRHLFTLNGTTGELSFNAAPAYQHGGDNTYMIEVEVTDNGNGAICDPLSTTQMIEVNVVPKTQVLNVQALLQGPYNGTDMSDHLRQLNLIPPTEPYTSLANATSSSLCQAKAPTVTTPVLNQGLLAEENNDAIVDWVLLELQDASNTEVASRALLIQKDGDIVTADTGSADIKFYNLPDGDYHVVLQHRNHVPAKSALMMMDSTAPINIDFRDLPSTNTTIAGEPLLDAGAFSALWAGDVNCDHRIIAQGNGNEINLILGNILSASGNTYFNSNYIVNGYLTSDVNMDGRTVFSGQGTELNTIIGNVLLHPSNISHATNFVIQ